MNIEKTVKNYSGKCSIDAMSKDDLYALHGSAVEVLRRTGMIIKDKEAVEIYADNGADVSKKNGDHLVKLPFSMVEKAIQDAPSQIYLQGRKNGSSFSLRFGGEPRFAPFMNSIKIVDPATRKIRPVTKEDSIVATKILEHCDCVDLLRNPITPVEVPAATMPLHVAHSIFPYTTKPIQTIAFTQKEIRQLKELEAIVAKDLGEDPKPFIIRTGSGSPLFMGKERCQPMIGSAREGQILGLGGMTMGGSTAPIDVAGNTVQSIAEYLAQITLVQLVRPGHPVFITSYISLMDLKAAVGLMAAPENALGAIAIPKIFELYKIPCSCTFCSDSKWIDFQCGFEKAMMVMAGIMGGNSLMFGIGGLESGLLWDNSQALLDNEMLRNLKFLFQGLEVTDETMSVDIIDEIGPMGNYFLAPSTLQKMRSTSSYEIMDRKARKDGYHTSPLQTIEIANEKVNAMIEELKDFSIVSEKCMRELDEFMAEAEKEALIQ